MSALNVFARSLTVFGIALGTQFSVPAAETNSAAAANQKMIRGESGPYLLKAEIAEPQNGTLQRVGMKSRRHASARLFRDADVLGFDLTYTYAEPPRYLPPATTPSTDHDARGNFIAWRPTAVFGLYTPAKRAVGRKMEKFKISPQDEILTHTLSASLDYLPPHEEDRATWLLEISTGAGLALPKLQMEFGAKGAGLTEFTGSTANPGSKGSWVGKMEDRTGLIRYAQYRIGPQLFPGSIIETTGTVGDSSVGFVAAEAAHLTPGQPIRTDVRIRELSRRASIKDLQKDLEARLAEGAPNSWVHVMDRSTPLAMVKSMRRPAPVSVGEWGMVVPATQ